MRFFVSTAIVPQLEAWMVSHSTQVEAFGSILQELAESVFGFPKSIIQLFYDESGSTIAFNQSGSLFCNFHYYSTLYSQLGAAGRSDALTYWWVVLCHELAHNLVEDHSAEHGFYTQSFVTQYFPKVMQRVQAGSSASFA